mgnify:CR=1 FL=1
MANHRVTFTLNHLVGELNKSADRILREEFGLTYSQFLFLVHLGSGGTVSSSVLAKNLGVSRAAVSKRVSWFTSRGLVRSGHISFDSRVLTLALTSKGTRLVAQMSNRLEQRFRERFDSFEEVDLDELNQTLMSILDHLRQPREASLAS